MTRHVVKGIHAALRRATPTYGLDELEGMLLDGLAPLVCQACGHEVGQAEPDARETADPCPECGAPGDQVASALVLAGLI